MAIKYWVNYLELALVPVKYGENGLRVSYKQPSRCVLQKAPLKNFAKFTRKHRARICFFLLLRESGTCVFLSTSRTFSEQLFNGLSLKQSSRQVSQNKCSAKFHIYIKKHLYGITFAQLWIPPNLLKQLFMDIIEAVIWWCFAKKLLSKFSQNS